MTTQYKLTTNLDQYTIIFNGWTGKHNIHDTTSAHTHPDFVQWLINGINTGSVEFDVETEDDDLRFEFSGQEVIDKASFAIGNWGDSARGFQLVAHQVIEYDIETDEESIAVITNDIDELVELIEDREDLFLSYLHCFGIYPETRCAITPTSHTYTYTMTDLTHSGEVKDTIESQLYATMADTLLEWTQWYDDYTFTDRSRMDDTGFLEFTWVFTHPRTTNHSRTILSLVNKVHTAV